MTADAELMPIPLWHGTSSWFVPGILEHGLGAVDVHAQLRSRAFFQAAWELRLQIAPPEEQQKLREGYGFQARAIIDDAVTPGGFNYRYGSVYCFGMTGRAVHFAARGYGSELVRLGAAWLDEIKTISPDAAASILADYPEMAACLAEDHKPIVVRLDGIERRHVRLDDGDEVPPLPGDYLDGFAFELVTPPDRTTVTVFRVENVRMGFATAEDYSLVPIQGTGP